MAHGGSIWDVDVVSNKNTNKKFSGSTFVTCSSDCTVRVWNVETESENKSQCFEDLVRVLHVDNDFSLVKSYSLNDSETSSDKGQRCLKLNDTCTEVATGDK